MIRQHNSAMRSPADRQRSNDEELVGIDLPQCIERLKRLHISWSNRAAVKQPAPDADLPYDPHKSDFLVELLPFRDHPLFVEASRHFQQVALSCGWLAYNAKTAAIESMIVAPACLHLINGDVGEMRYAKYRSTIAQALADEAYHIVLVDAACDITRARRGLASLSIPPSELVTSMQRRQEQHPERWKKILIQIATAIVSETLITDYLGLLSRATDIQPLNQITTEIHRRDEAAHNGLFQTLGALIYHGLDRPQREYFLEVLAEPASWFANSDWDVWESMLQQVGFPHAGRMVRECRAEQPTRNQSIDLTTLTSLYDELGLEDSNHGRFGDVLSGGE